jgi:HAE1 family hydrophobic/amphiphilic exporter-1
LEVVTSKNLQGVTQITLQFDLKKNVEAAALDVQSAIQRSLGNLPPDMPAPPIFEKTDPNSQPIFFLAIASATLPAGQLYDFASDQIAQRFNTIQGVSKTDVYGIKRAVRVHVDPSKLSSRNLAMDDISRAIQSSSVSISAGVFKGEKRSRILRPDGQLDGAKDYANLMLSNGDGGPIFLRDVATCRDGVELDSFTNSFWIRDYGSFDTVVLAITRSAGANTVAVARELRNLIPEIRSQIPESIFMTTVYDRSQSILASINDVQETILIAFALVTLVIFLFLGRIRDTVIPVVALPLSLFILFLAMHALGLGLDNLSLMAMTLSVGFLVDDAIVFLENMVRRMQKFGENPITASIHGASEISSTIVSMTLALASIFIPLLFLGGQVGRVFHEFSLVIIIATLASGLVSLTLTPLMCSSMLRPHSRDRRTRLEIFAERLEEKFLRTYSRALDFVLDHRWISLACWAACLVGTGLCFAALPKTFLPEGDSGVLRGIFLAQEGTSPRQMAVYQRQIDEVLHKNPAVYTAFTISGIPGLPGNQGMAMAFLNPVRERPSVGRVSQSLMGDFSQIPGIITLLRPMPSLQIQAGTMGTNQGKYSYTVSGIDPEQVYAASQNLLQALRAYDGFASLSSDLFLNNPEVRISMNRDQIGLYGSSVYHIESQFKAAYSENYVYLIKSPTQQYQVIVDVDERFRTDSNDLELLRHRGMGSELLDASTVTSWHTAVGPLAVNHTNKFPSVTLFFDLKPGVAIGDAMEHIQQTAQRIIPRGIQGTFQGEARTFAEAFASLKILIFVAAFVTYIILGILYESYAHPITVLSSLPVAAFGGLATLLLCHQELSLYAYIGLFMLLGIVEKNGIMIIDFALQRQRENMAPRDAIHAASMQRFRPIIMTTLAMVMGILPIALGWGMDGASRRPLGLVVVGGMIFAQVITLFVTPAIYVYMDTFQSRVLDKIPLFKRHSDDEKEPLF